MESTPCPDLPTAGSEAALCAAGILRETLATEGEATLVADPVPEWPAFWEELAGQSNLDWGRISIAPLPTCGVGGGDAEAFAKTTEAVELLWEGFVRKLPKPPRRFVCPDLTRDPEMESWRLRENLRHLPLDLTIAAAGLFDADPVPPRTLDLFWASRHFLLLDGVPPTEDGGESPPALFSRHPGLRVFTLENGRESELLPDTILPA